MTTQPDHNPPSCQRRIIQFPVTRIVLALLAIVLAILAAQLTTVLLPFDGDIDWAGRVQLAQPIEAALPLGIALQAVRSALTIILFTWGAYYAYVHLVEHRGLTELALAGALRELGGGVLIGAALFTAAICVLAALGLYTVDGINHWSILTMPLTGALISAFLEEIMFRGILFRIVEESLGTWLALLISAAAFGLLHLGNPDATLVASLAIIIEAGILLAAAYVLTRRLWLAIGIHLAWNFTQSGIFGLSETQGLLQARLSGPNWLSGGEYGLEASLVTVVLCSLVALCFLARAIQQDRIRPPFWSRAPSIRH